jgi:hypothetical protein
MLKLVYPVGRHIGFRELETGKMKFLKMPSDAKCITALCFNTQKNLLAVAVKIEDFKGYE